MSNEQDKGMEADILAATLSEGLEESQDLLEFLSSKFEGPLSHLMSVRRKGGLLSKKRSVQEITLRFEDRHFQIERHPRGFIIARILKEVRGVVLKRDEVEVADWIRELSGELSRQARRSTELREALSQFILR